VSVTVYPRECVVLSDPSGSGKSTLLRLVYGNYRAQAGAILVRHGEAVVDVATVPPRLMQEMRRQTIGYVSQFLRVVPRVPLLEVVAEPLRLLGVGAPAARVRARDMLVRLGLPERLWGLSPVTFSGGEQQRVNLARVFVIDYPVLLLDEPTASLDPASARIVIDLIAEAWRRGAAVLGAVHDADVRQAIATRVVRLGEPEAA
jgi:alpha-D-ribose 1-methylphosphonate 5-triphosphate synthase subunit PhnL